MQEKSATDKLAIIFDGWKNYTFKSALVEQMARSRAKICAECPHSKESIILSAIVPEPIKEIKSMVCALCNCPLSGKTRATAEGCADNPPRW